MLFRSEALASYTVMSNLKFRVIHYDRDKVKDVVYNGQYMLGVGEPDVYKRQVLSGIRRVLTITIMRFAMIILMMNICTLVNMV